MRLTEQMKRTVTDQSLGFVATVRPDGTPALSPKGTTRVWDDDHLVFLHIHSAGTVANLASNPAVEINVVDPIRRKGWRFAGCATVHTHGALFDQVITWYDRPGSASAARAVVLIEINRAEELISPAYDTGASEQEIAHHWRQHHLAPGNRATHTGGSALPGSL